MSYDLYFTKPKITHDQFAAFFRCKRNFEISNQQYLYKNDDTGVYFIIDYNDQTGADPTSIDSIASVSLNYFRPHFFGLEALTKLMHSSIISIFPSLTHKMKVWVMAHSLKMVF